MIYFSNNAFDSRTTAAPDIVANLQKLKSGDSLHLQNSLLYYDVSAEVPSSAATDGLLTMALNREDMSFAVEKMNDLSILL